MARLAVAVMTLSAAQADAAVVVDISDFSGGRVIQTDGVTKTTLLSGLNQPMGIGVGAGGTLYVAQQSGTRIGRYTATGQSLGSTFGTGRPYTGLAIGPDGEVYANGAENSYGAGVVERYVPSTGTAHGTGQAPGNTAGFTSSFGSSYFEGLTFGPDGNLYVSAHSSGAIRIYQGPGGTSPGTLISTLTGVSQPDGLAFGPDGKLYVTEQNLNRVSRWNGSSFSVFASGAQLSTPIGLGFGPDGDLYVANYTGGTIAHFRGPSATTPGTFVSTFASGIGNPGYILVTPEPSTLLIVLPCAAALALRRFRWDQRHDAQARTSGPAAPSKTN